MPPSEQAPGTAMGMVGMMRLAVTIAPVVPPMPALVRLPEENRPCDDRSHDEQQRPEKQALARKRGSDQGPRLGESLCVHLNSGQ
jgi:hypothetical protein